MSVKPVTPVNTLLQPLQNEHVPTGYNPETKKQAAQEPHLHENRVSREDAEALAEFMNKASKLYNHQLSFDVYEETNQVYVKIIDKVTREVIKQIPQEEMLELSAKIREMVGIILDEYV